MLDNTLTLDFGTGTVILTRVNQDDFASTYFGESGSDKLSLSVKHTIPGRGQPGESHLVRLDVEHYDATGAYQRTSSAWLVVKTFDGTQDSAVSLKVGLSLQSFVGVSANLQKVLARES